MATGVGLRIGNAESVAAVVSDSAPTTPEYLVRTTQFTGASPTTNTPDPTLIATSMLALLGDVTTRIAPPDSIVATYPNDWSADTVESVRTSLLSLGLDEVALVADDGVPTDHEAAYRGARLAAASLAESTTTLVVPRMAAAAPLLAYSQMPDAPAAQRAWTPTRAAQPSPAWSAPAVRPAPPRYSPPRYSPPTMEFAPIRVPPQPRRSSGSGFSGFFLLLFVITVIGTLLYLSPNFANFTSAFGRSSESANDSSNFTSKTVTDEETTQTTTATTEKPSTTSKTSTTSQMPTSSASTSTSEPTLTNSAGSSPLGLG
ncbi:hypothetical protein [Smaragdicoccus niigatensis]|uniref:hypothetical protein n=1 Tax=Smaragdicoccus niigatensis TaxID=359359 RepID=UPI00035E9CBB|nr:hypothetical protein [Smaragdicoccus niigatensis]